MAELMNINNQNGEQELSFKEVILKLKGWINYLKTKWVIIVLASVLGAATGLTYALLKKPTYIATLSFALEDDKPIGGGLSSALGLASSLGIDLGTSAGGAFSGSNLIELMKSRNLVERALLNPINIAGKSMTIAEYYINFSDLREDLDEEESLTNIHYLLNESRDKFSIQKDSVLGEIYKKVVGIKVDPLLTVAQKDKKISIINVDVASENENFSKALSESLVKEVSEYYINTKSKKARTNVGILQRQTDSIRNELNQAISGVAQAADNTFNLNPALNIKRVPSSHRQVDVQANTAILTQLVTNLELAKVTLLKETPLIQIIDKPILPLTKEKLGKVKTTILFGFLFGFFASLYIIFKKILKGLLAQ